MRIIKNRSFQSGFFKTAAALFGSRSRNGRRVGHDLAVQLIFFDLGFGDNVVQNARQQFLRHSGSDLRFRFFKGNGFAVTNIIDNDNVIAEVGLDRFLRILAFFI